jgi:hypothetical protein
MTNEVVSVMFIDGVPRFVILENKHKLIPIGTYHAKRDIHYGSPSVEDYIVWEFYDIPGHSQVQIHIGNLFTDSKMCPLIGTSFSTESYSPMITLSRAAFLEFMDMTKNETELEIDII